MTKPEWDAADFAEFFTALWGKPPFAWQRELARRVLERGAALTDSPGVERGGPWPQAIALPTASGKTACMDIAVFALAAQAVRLESGRTVTAPRRIFFVVDRRVIVDEAYERAHCLAEKLEKAKQGILKSAADNLRRIARGENAGFADERPLSVHVLRGGMYRSEAWARSPLQPTVTASTVDQIGSRLLFRAYGRGPNIWPIYAGLAANDSLILLDEAHCAQPFLQTLRAVGHFRTWAEAPLRRRFHPVVMSATPPRELQDVFEDRSDESNDPGSPLGRRRLARKPAILREIAKAKGNRAADVWAKSLAEAAVDLIDGQRRAVAVFVNRVAAARKTWRLLREREDIEAVLLTGRMRPIDKDAVVGQLKPLRSNQSEKRTLPKPLVVVATQTLEVGADLDFDGLVTECAGLDALRQRFGRLNRMGRPIEARAAILIRGDQIGEKADDPIYGKALANTWHWLNECKDNNGEVDFGIAHLDPRLPQGEDLAKLNTPARDAPVMLPAHVDCWAQTSPAPSPSPDVAPFLHGESEGAPDVQVCWRADLDLEKEPGAAAALDILRLCPPSSSETLPVPVGVFRRCLAGEDAEDDSADVEGAATDNAADSRTSPAAAERRIVRWRGADTKRENITAKPADIRPGDVIVIPAGHPGPWERLGDLPPDAVDPVEALDAGDQAYRLARAKPILRLHPKLIDAWPDSAPKETACELLRGTARKYEEDPDEAAEAVRGLLRELAEPAAPFPERWLWLPQAAGELDKEFAGPKRPDLHFVGKEENESLILVGRRRIAELAREADSFSDEDDAAASGIARPVRLDNHLRGVEEFARRYALGCGLPPDLAETVACAGLLHDTGKADPRFQSLLQGGARWLGGEPLAKSTAMPNSAYERARKAAGYPQGGRHELLSMRLAESAPQLLPESDELRDLTLYLIAAHHGRCRPFAPAAADDCNETVAFALSGARMQRSCPARLERLDSGTAERYWRLARRYGWWGLAWLEALLRLADWQRSEWEETHDDGA